MRKLCSIFLSLILSCAPLWAQWSGSANLSGGFGGMDGSYINDYQPMWHSLAEGAFRLNYKTEKFRWSTALSGKWEPKTTDNTRIAYKNEKLNLTYKAASTQPLTASIRSDFEWLPSKASAYSTWILYQYKNDQAYNHSLNFDGNEKEMENLSYNFEVPVMNEHKAEAGVKGFHDFDSGRHVIEGSFSFQAISGQKVNTWSVFKTDPGVRGGGTAVTIENLKGYAWRYRITPQSLDLNIDADIHLHNIVMDGEAKMKVTPGIRFASKQALDQNSGATSISLMDEGPEEYWRDSTRLRESFNYLSIQAEDYLVGDMSWKNLEAHIDYALQVYARRLNDDEHKQTLKIKGMYPVGKANLKWNISPHHSLNFAHQMSVKHPDYLKICWYDRTAGYLDQLYRGNEQLLSPQTLSYTLEYAFTWKRFLSRTSVTYKDVINEIDQTWHNEEIDGRQYKVFLWLNSADSRSVGLSQSLGWRGKRITANLGITYNQSQRTAKNNSGNVKNSFDWKLTGDISAKLGKGWTVGMDAKYQSKVATFFTIFKQYCELNAIIQKEFKHVTVFLQGKDLLDTPRETSFESEELKEYWVEQVRSNRRVILLGAKWKF